MMSLKKMQLKENLLVGDVAKRTGVAISTIHFYEKKGLISSFRDSSNHRRFHRDVLRIISVIRIAQGSGIQLVDIKSELSRLPNNKKITVKDWSSLSNHWRQQLDARINNLISLRDNLDNCIGCGCLSLKTCKLINPNDKAANLGPGSHIFTTES